MATFTRTATAEDPQAATAPAGAGDGGRGRKTTVGTRTPARPPSRLGSDIVAAGLAALAYAALGGGFADPVYVPAILVGAFIGMVTALAASSPVRATAIATVVAGAGALLAPPPGAGTPAALLAAGSAGAAAFAIGFATRRGLVRTGMVVALGALLVLGSLWLTTATWATQPGTIAGASTFQFLATPPPPGTETSDQSFYLSVYYRMKQGSGYYDAFRDAYISSPQWGYPPPSVIAVRQPALITSWTWLPGDGRSIVWALTALATAACLASLLLGRLLGGDAAGLTSAAIAGAYFAHFTTLPVVTWFEPWGGALALIAVALFVASSRVPEAARNLYVFAAAGVAALASAVRELMLFVPVAGVAAAAFAPRERRRIELAAWGTSLLLAVAALAAHSLAAQRIVVARGDLGTWVGRGGLVPLFSALTTGTRFLAWHDLTAPVLGVLGIVAALTLLRGHERLFVAACATIPLALFLFAWNGAVDVATGKAVNYWGAIVAPLLFALAPSAITLAVRGLPASREVDR